MIVLVVFIVSLFDLIMGGCFVGLFMSGPIGIFAGPLVALFAFWLLPLFWALNGAQCHQLKRFQVTQAQFVIQGGIIGFSTFGILGILGLVFWVRNWDNTRTLA